MSYRDDDWAVDRPAPDLWDDRPSRRDFAADERAALDDPHYSWMTSCQIRPDAEGR